MPAQKPASWSYAEEFPTEPESIEQARTRGAELSARPVTAGVGAFLRTLAASLDAAHVVEIGTGAGASGLWLLEGMASDGVLTTIDVEGEQQRAARAAFQAAGVGSPRTRTIVGAALDVLPRLTSGAYDLVVVDADPLEYPEYAEQAARLVRRGGALVLDDMLWQDRVADPAARDRATTTLRDLGKALRSDERWWVSLLPVGDGVLLAVRR